MIFVAIIVLVAIVCVDKVERIQLVRIEVRTHHDVLLLRLQPHTAVIRVFCCAGTVLRCAAVSLFVGSVVLQLIQYLIAKNVQLTQVDCLLVALILLALQRPELML